MYWRRFAVSDIPLEDQAEFDTWLRERWSEKDLLMDQYFETGRFPTELAGTIEAESGSAKQKAVASDGFVEAHVRLGHWSELARIFMVVTMAACLCKLPKVLTR